ncbi:restriction endonuclease subunit S [Lactobacillus amylovorus]|uniref:restriction endonuclease subunit S n=1 Tax=Lactobacillus amylovorus TaxID=1604 RepID=UPI003F8A45CB
MISFKFGIALLLFTFFVWEQRKLGTAIKIIKDKNKNQHSYRAFSISNIKGFIAQDEQFGKDNTYSKTDKSTNYIVKPGMFAYNPARINVGSIAYQSQTEPVLVSSLYEIFQTNSKIDDSFLMNWFKTSLFNRQIKRLEEGGVRQYFFIDKMKETEIKLPSISEQNQISKLLQLVNKNLDLQQRKLKLLRTLKSGLSFKLFNKKHLNNLSQISLDQIGQTYSGLTGKSKKDFGHGHAFYVSYLNVNQNEIGNPKQIDRIEIDKKQNLVQKNDIFFTISSETPEEVGLTSLWPVSCKNLYLNSFCFGFRINTKMFIPLYLGYLFRSEYFREKVLPLAQGISRYNLSKNNVLKIKIGQEEIAIQEKYAKVMNDLDSDILRQKKKVKELKLCKKFLLQNMFI